MTGYFADSEFLRNRKKQEYTCHWATAPETRQQKVLTDLSGKKILAVDLDGTLTGQDIPYDVMIYHIFDKIGNAKNGASKIHKAFSKAAKAVVHKKLIHNPDTDPKAREIDLIGKFSRGLDKQYLEIGIDKLPINEELIEELQTWKNHGDYTIVVVTSAPDYSARYWTDQINQKLGTELIDYVVGLSVKIDKKGKVRGLNKGDIYTKIATKGGIGLAKDFAYSLLSTIGSSIITIGNAPGDVPDYSNIEKYGGDPDRVTHIQTPFGIWKTKNPLKELRPYAQFISKLNENGAEVYKHQDFATDQKTYEIVKGMRSRKEFVNLEHTYTQVVDAGKGRIKRILIDKDSDDAYFMVRVLGKDHVIKTKYSEVKPTIDLAYSIIPTKDF